MNDDEFNCNAVKTEWKGSKYGFDETGVMTLTVGTQCVSVDLPSFKQAHVLQDFIVYAQLRAYRRGKNQIKSLVQAVIDADGEF